MSSKEEPSPTSTQLETLQWQFRMTWRLAGIHLPALSDEMCFWEPTPGCWTVRHSMDGKWRPDWQVPEPVPAPPVTIGWLTWQIIWWWSGVLSAVRDEKPAAHDEVFWPGSAEAAVQRIESLFKEWNDVLSGFDDGDLERALAYPWPAARPLRLAIAWVNSELMKNVAEIGIIRHIFLMFQDTGGN